MSVYMITYFISDTTGHNHDHDENHTHSHDHVQGDANLIGKIKSFGPWARFLPEGFFVKTSSSADEIFAEVSSVANKGDLIFVTKIDAKSSACANPAVLDWLAE